ncbi:MAG TPA: transcription antitermination factor NusB [Acidimicrobiales bacterium]|nr:transcription antitermination factor NusB [Acidimicrobiales bacterium]
MTEPPAARPGRVGGGSTARAVAIDAMVRIEEGAYANLVLPELLAASNLAPRDRAFATALVYGTTRMRRACDWLVDRFVDRPLEPVVRAVLRLGAYQLVFLGTPAHAGVSAMVDVAPTRAKGLVNAVLRKVAADPSPRWPDAATRLSYPDWIIRRMAEDLGLEDAEAALEQMNVAAEITERDDGYVQDPASQEVAAEVGVSAGERVVDLCAAPGGKATAMAAAMARGAREVGARSGEAGARSRPAGAGSGAARFGSPVEAGARSGRTAEGGLVIAADSSVHRARLVASNVDRLGSANVAVLVADGRRPPFAAGTVDRVLVDAPCTGLGVLRRRPDARWRINVDDVDRLAALQRELLAGAITLLRPGATLVYSVCTLTLAETAEVDNWLAESHPDLVALPPPGPPWAPLARGARLLPQSAGTDGMFLLKLRRHE